MKNEKYILFPRWCGVIETNIFLETSQMMNQYSMLLFFSICLEKKTKYCKELFRVQASKIGYKTAYSFFTFKQIKLYLVTEDT